MDKNSSIGFLLIGLILFGFFLLNKPSEEQVAQQKKAQQTALLAQQQKALEAETNSSTAVIDPSLQLNDSLQSLKKVQEFGILYKYAEGENTVTTLENDEVKVLFSNKGAKVQSVELKGYLTADKKPLVLFDGAESDFSFNFFTVDNRQIKTSDLYFETANVVNSGDNKSITFRIKNANNENFDIQYNLNKGSYVVDMKLMTKGLQGIVSRSVSSLDLTWNLRMRQIEKGVDFERRYSGLYYKYKDDAVESITGKDEKEDLTTKVEWIGFKDQFFASVLIANTSFSSAKVTLQKNDTPGYLYNFTSDIVVPYQEETIELKYYFGPTKYKYLRETGHDLEKLISLGWPPVNWVNRFLVIPLFNLLSSWIGNFGLIILILTLVIKIIIFPFTYKSYLSTAKMKVLKPQIDEINKKIPAEKALERQQATMALYKKVGVSPLGGCLPMLLQFPFLIAMFFFFPASIELRQEAFLWADDLASYDAIISWQTQIPIISSILGNHISLFCVLMTIASIVSTMMNAEMSASSTTMPGMKTMMYMMPVMFFFMFNNYSSGLSFYYFVSTVITIGQTFIMRRFVDDNALLAQLEENKKKPAKPKSGFSERLEKMQKQQQQLARERAKTRK